MAPIMLLTHEDRRTCKERRRMTEKLGDGSFRLSFHQAKTLAARQEGCDERQHEKPKIK